MDASIAVEGSIPVHVVRCITEQPCVTGTPPSRKLGLIILGLHEPQLRASGSKFRGNHRLTINDDVEQRRPFGCLSLGRISPNDGHPPRFASGAINGGFWSNCWNTSLGHRGPLLGHPSRLTQNWTDRRDGRSTTGYRTRGPSQQGDNGQTFCLARHGNTEIYKFDLKRISPKAANSDASSHQSTGRLYPRERLSSYTSTSPTCPNSLSNLP